MTEVSGVFQSVAAHNSHPWRRASLSNEQLRFLHLHTGAVTEWRERWNGSQIQARSGTVTATLERKALLELVRLGLMEFSHGVSVVLTDATRAQLEEETT